MLESAPGAVDPILNRCRSLINAAALTRTLGADKGSEGNADAGNRCGGRNDGRQGLVIRGGC